MVTGTNASIISRHIRAAPRSKHSSTLTNKFVINELYLEQSYYWTEIWQKGEKEADEDIRQGKVNIFKSADDTINYLRSKRI